LKNKLFLIISFIVTLAYVLYKAYSLGFTHDESISYLICKGDWGWMGDPNNHRLNTFLMQLSGSVFGYSEFSLRLPNVLAFILYFFSVYFLLKRVQNKTAIYMGYLLMIFNPYLIEFFSMARGYGLAISFLALAILFVRYFIEKGFGPLYLYLLSISLMASAWSNFSFLNAFGGLGISILAVVVLSEKRNKVFRLRYVLILIPLFIGVVLFFLKVKAILFDMKERGLLYEGGKNGIWDDTFFSLVDLLFYNTIYSSLIINTLLCIAMAGLTLIVWGQIKKRNCTNLTALMLFSCCFTVLLILINHYLFDVNYPMERTAIYFYLFGGLLFVLGLSNERIMSKKWIERSLIVLNFILLANFVYSINVNSFIEDVGGRHTKKIMQKMKKAEEGNTEKAIDIGVYWHFEPIVNYYREEYKLHHILPATREGVFSKEYDYYYVRKEEKDSLEKTGIKLSVLLQEFNPEVYLLKKENQ
jgi:hypothetical protein